MTTFQESALVILSSSKMNIEEIAGKLGLAPSLVSRHLPGLEQQGLVSSFFENGRLYIQNTDKGNETALELEKKGLSPNVTREIRKEINQFAFQMYDRLSIKKDFNTSISEIHKGILKTYGLNLGDDAISNTLSVELAKNGGTLLHNFFHLMIDDFKRAYGGKCTRKNPGHLHYEVRVFIEYEYRYGGSMTSHERIVLSDILGRRDDIVMKRGSFKYRPSGSKGNLGYFNDFNEFKESRFLFLPHP